MRINPSRKVNQHLYKAGQVLLALVLAAAVSSCGFQLRDDYHIATEIQHLRLEGDNRSEAYRAVAGALERRAVELKEGSDYFPAVILGDDRLERRILSMLASGQVAEYELIYVMPVTIILANGDAHEHNIQILRDYQDDPNFALAKTRELELLVQEMRSEAARRLLMLLNRTVRE